MLWAVNLNWVIFRNPTIDWSIFDKEFKGRFLKFRACSLDSRLCGFYRGSPNNFPFPEKRLPLSLPFSTNHRNLLSCKSNSTSLSKVLQWIPIWISKSKSSFFVPLKNISKLWMKRKISIFITRKKGPCCAWRPERIPS